MRGGVVTARRAHHKRPRFTVGDGEWRERAACVGLDIELFYPDPTDTEGIAAAVAVCQSCPVTDLCLADALHTRDQHGIRGGLTPNQRANRRRVTRSAA